MATWPTIINDDGSGTTGTVLDEALFTAIKAYIDAAAPPGLGQWQTVPFAAGNFTAAGSMTWTVSAGQVPFNRYTQFGKTLLWSVYIAGGVLGGTASNAVYITLPNGLSATGNAGTAATGQLYDGVHQPGFVSIDATGPKLRIQKQTEGTFGLGPTYIRFTVVLEVL